MEGRRARVVSHPLRYDGERPALRTMPLVPGCDSRAILAEHGFSPDDINILVDEGVVAVREVGNDASKNGTNG